MFIPDEARNKIIRIFGENGISFFNKLDDLLIKYKEKWKLSNLCYYNSVTVNLIFFCTCEEYGEVVLKFGVPSKEISTEINTLEFYNNKGMCKIFKSNIEDAVFLLERISPGDMLKKLPNYINRANIMSNIIKNFHIECNRTDIFPTYQEWLNKIYIYMEKVQNEHPKLFKYISMAKDISLELNKTYNRTYLLHGDLHHENILLNKNNKYIVIDPKGVIGDPIFETSRYIENEFEFDGEDKYSIDKINHIVDIFNYNLKTPKEVILKTLFIDNIISNCWCIEDNCPQDEYIELNKTCDFVYNLCLINNCFTTN